MGRDSLVLYTAYIDKFKKLSDAQFGQLIRAVMTYQQTETAPDIDDLSVSVAFDVVRHDLDINNIKYDEAIEKRKTAGKQGAEKRWHNIANDSNAINAIANDSNAINAIAQDSTEWQAMAKIAVNDTVTDTVTDTDTVNDTVNDIPVNGNVYIGSDEPPHISKKPTKHQYGEYKHVLLTDDEYIKLVQERGQAKTEAAITFLDEYLEMNGKSYKSCYLALRKWVFDALEEKKTSTGQKAVNKVAQQLDSFYQMANEWAERG